MLCVGCDEGKKWIRSRNVGYCNETRQSERKPIICLSLYIYILLFVCMIFHKEGSCTQEQQKILHGRIPLRKTYQKPAVVLMCVRYTKRGHGPCWYSTSLCYIRKRYKYYCCYWEGKKRNKKRMSVSDWMNTCLSQQSHMSFASLPPPQTIKWRRKKNVILRLQGENNNDMNIMLWCRYTNI